MYEKGTIKLTWINPTDYTVLDSSMYKSVDEALANSKDKKNFMLFELTERAGDTYKWKLLPYGSYKEFVRGMKLRDSKLAKIGMIAVLGFALFGIYKLVTR